MAGLPPSATLGRRPSPIAPRRFCARPACGADAEATMTYDYGARTAWLDQLDCDASPAGYDLCATHADRLGVPSGWSRTDRRTPTDSAFTRLAV